MKEIVAQKKWVYTLYKTDKGMLLSVVCGSVAMFNADVLLSNEDACRAEQDESFRELLAERVRSNPKQYMPD